MVVDCWTIAIRRAERVRCEERSEADEAYRSVRRRPSRRDEADGPLCAAEEERFEAAQATHMRGARCECEEAYKSVRRRARATKQTRRMRGRTSPSSRGLGHRPFTAATRVRIPLGTPFIANDLDRFPIKRAFLRRHLRVTLGVGFEFAVTKPDALRGARDR